MNDKVWYLVLLLSGKISGIAFSSNPGYYPLLSFAAIGASHVDRRVKTTGTRTNAYYKLTTSCKVVQA